MKKLLLILLCLPMIGFGQDNDIDIDYGENTPTYESIESTKHFHYAMQNIEAEEYKLAIENLDISIFWNVVADDNAELYYYRGLAYANLGNLGEAIADFTKAIEIEPDIPGNAILYYNRGLAYAKLGNLSEAIADFTKAIKIKPDCC